MGKVFEPTIKLDVQGFKVEMDMNPTTLTADDICFLLNQGLRDAEREACDQITWKVAE